ncbi:acetylcholinesterase-like [Rhipicephalus microplus]|uniref:acetylcholinesterase-like n=1 Tax=Rhipicephalus microplus TaxID=6941 RepID=UPI003F6AC8A8
MLRNPRWLKISKPSDMALPLHNFTQCSDIMLSIPWTLQMMTYPWLLVSAFIPSAHLPLSMTGCLSGDAPCAAADVAMGDQTMALQWVLDHIARFGGNASDVVLMSSASGAWSVGAHLLKDGTDGPRFWSRERFSKVILMSESPFRRYFDDKSHELPSLLDCYRGGTVEKLHCLRIAPLREIVHATSEMVHYFGPSASAHPSLKDASRITGWRFLLDTVSNEGTHLLDYLKTTSPPDASVERVLPTFLKRIYSINNGADIIDAFRKANAPDEKVTASGASWASELLGDLFYTCPLLRLGRELATRERNLVSGYVFDHRPSFALFNDTTGSARFMDLDFVFGRPLDGSRAANEQEQELSRRIIDMWATFAKTGNLPFVNGQPWPRYTDDGKDVQEVRDYKKNSCAVLPSLVDRKRPAGVDAVDAVGGYASALS